MISVEEALEKILNLVRVLEREERPLLDCLGQTLADDIYAPFNIPPGNNSAMDGYAVQFESIKGASRDHPSILSVIGESPAGDSNKFEVTPGTAVRIMTGALLPEGADVVVPFEETNEGTLKQTDANTVDIAIYREIARGSNIRQKGEDIVEGNLVISKGTFLRPAEIGVLASLGMTVVPVIRKPVVAILATGNELVDIFQERPPSKIYNSNSYSLAAQILRYGGIPRILGVARDEISELTKAIRRGLDADMLITTGGVSLGDYDIVKDVLAKEGEIHFWTVRMKPGKPLAFGTLTTDDGKIIPHLGLPGNPVSAMITFEIFGRSALLKMMGRRNLEKPTIQAILEDGVVNTDDRRIYTRVWVTREGEEFHARLTGPQGSGILTSMSSANGLAIIPEDVKETFPGTVVEVIMLGWDEG
ncbi:MAG: molybdopterin molybdotransferase MoeA [Dehalococcoidia bacterium]